MPRFTPEFLDELKTRLRPSDVIGRHVKLKKQGNEYAGLSPFTKEKSPSFFVNDQKGFYHCFSSGKHGDIISFLQDVQKLEFHEAVTRLAEDAGMEIPKDTPQEAAAAKRQAGLAEACEAAAAFYEASLRRAPGRHAAEYLKRRGVTEAQVKAFRIGFAPDGGPVLKDYLINNGFNEQTLIEAGLVIKPEEATSAGRGSYDRFRNRIMFPILGPRDRVIAFGGRALDPNARAKYLNSPETPLFHKGTVLYNLGQARIASGDEKAPLIVCEGYMDVIALWGAGIKRAVAPLGTALTEQQLALLWRSSDEPVLCFDGDGAGQRAAHRAIDRALPMLQPRKSLSFAFLPEGQDPDDLLRDKGTSAFESVLKDTIPFVEALWRREEQATPLDTPERRAGLKAHLRTLVKGIADADVRAAYGAELAGRLDAYFARPKQANHGGQAYQGQQGYRDKPGGGGYNRQRPDRNMSRAPWNNPFRDQQASFVQGGGTRRAPSSWIREATLVLAALHFPSLVERCESEFLELELQDPDLTRLLNALLGVLLQYSDLDSDGVKRHLENTKAADILERILNDESLNKQSFLQPGTDLALLEAVWRDNLRRQWLQRRMPDEVSQSAAHIIGGDEQWKAAINAREALYNEKNEDQSGQSLSDISSKEFFDRLDKVKADLEQKRKKH